MSLEFCPGSQMQVDDLDSSRCQFCEGLFRVTTARRLASHKVEVPDPPPTPEPVVPPTGMTRSKRRYDVKAVGVTFAPRYPDVIFDLEKLAAQRFLYDDSEPIPAVLVRNPANPYDASAIEVHVPALGDDAMVGHLPAGVAARIAPEIDSGTPWDASVHAVQVHPEHPDRPGIHIYVQPLVRA